MVTPSRNWQEWRRYERASNDHRSGTRRLRGGVAMRAARRRGRALRDAAGSADASAPDRRFCRTGLLEFAEIHFYQYCAVAAEGRDEARRLAAAGTSAGVFS